jgi:hypothetical protein
MRVEGRLRGFPDGAGRTTGDSEQRRSTRRIRRNGARAEIVALRKGERQLHRVIRRLRPERHDERGSRRLAGVVLGLLVLCGSLLMPAVIAPAAFADNCQTCEPEPEPEPNPNPPPPPVVHRVTVNWVEGWLNNDNSIQFHDEVYLKFNQATYWGPTSVGDLERESGYDVATNAAGAIRYPNVSTSFTWNSIDITLWDDDNSSADDWLGSVRMYANGSWSPVASTIDLYGSGAHYRINVSVYRIS